MEICSARVSQIKDRRVSYLVKNYLLRSKLTFLCGVENLRGSLAGCPSCHSSVVSSLVRVASGSTPFDHGFV